MLDSVNEKKIKSKFPLSKEEKKLMALVDENEDNIIKLLQDLVKIDSLNMSEFIFTERNEIFEFSKKFMDDAGFQTELYKAPFPGGKKNEFYFKPFY